MCGGTFFCTTSFMFAGLLLGLSPQNDLPRFIKPAHAAVLKQWLGTHQGLRVATDDDCAAPRRARCTGIAELRKSKPSYQPYYLSGDFNNDRVDDFVVVLIDPTKLIGDPALPDYAATVAVFNGPFVGKVSRPAFVESDLYLLDSALFFGPPRPRPYRLLIGGFESEGWILKPTAGGYECVYRACANR